MMQRLQLAQDRLEQTGKSLADEDDFGARIVEDVGNFGWRQPPVHGYQHGANLGGTEQNLEIAIGILVHCRDARTRFHA